ncbi:MAG: GAF domain-containing protein [Candidatus Cloacimonetes bacterium]|nr:GAF domain-containing protein [Candidatus Cloacimonadota bacterium]
MPKELLDYRINRKIRNTLINIANALNQTKNLSELFAHIRKHLNEIIDTTNFYIALYNSNTNMLSMIYEKDEKDNFEDFPLKGTLTGYVINTKKPLLATEEFHKKMRNKGELILLGSPSKIWLGVPLKIEEEIIGVVVVQSYTDVNLYSHKDMKILQFVSGLIAVVIDRKRAEDKLRKLNEELESRIIERTAKLQQSLETLQQTRDQLVQSEKMAALGDLVAGVAHEINTPVGIGVTAVSHLSEKTNEILKLYKNNTMKRSDLEKFLVVSEESSNIILTNLMHASENISSFKKVAVDRTKDEKRLFNIYEYVSDILTSLHPRIKKTKHKILLDCSKDLEIYSFPGAFSQVITNLVINSLIHGFKTKEFGVIKIKIAIEDKKVIIHFEDNGIGIEKETIKHIFEPFFTTNRIEGGTGLGLHIIYNIISHKLNGNIQCESTCDKYCRFRIEFPINKVDKNGK